jgi:transcriptional regulator with XRE-family HTH domain
MGIKTGLMPLSQIMRNPASSIILIQFGDALRESRNRLGLSQEELADRAGLDRTYLGGIERGERNVSLINIYAIAAALGEPVEMLFVRACRPEPKPRSIGDTHE